MWDVHLRKLLRHGASRFELDVRFASAAPRLVLFGPSGSGKTQTLRMLAGIARPEGGHARVAGRTLYDAAGGITLSAQTRRLGLVFQDYALFPHLTVRQNIAFGRRLGWRNPPRHGADAAVDRWIERFGLQAAADLLPQQLSGGQRQRTALARALAGEPVALLLDEPFAALDAGLRARLRDELAELQRTLGLPMLLITHDADDVACLADAVVHLDNGRVIGETPAAPRVARSD